MATEKKVKIELVRGLIGSTEKQKKVVKALGLTKRNSVVEHNDTPVIRGMITKVAHLVKEVEQKRGTTMERIKLTDLRPADGATHADKKCGRGRASGHGKTSCRGNNRAVVSVSSTCNVERNEVSF